MTSSEDDLRDIITELYGLHSPMQTAYNIAFDMGPICSNGCKDHHGNPALWPCHTAKIVDKYKRRAHRRRYIIHASAGPLFSQTQPPMKFAVTQKRPWCDGNFVHYFETMPEADAWIEQQYEENK